MKKILLAFTLSLILFVGGRKSVAAQQNGTPGFYFEPAEVTVKPQDIFHTDVILDTASQKALGGGAIITYDPLALTVLEVKVGTIFRVFPAATFDNGKGQINISGIVGSPTEMFNGRGTFATITWKLSKEANTAAFFNFVKGSTTDSNIAVSTGNGDILGQVGQLKVTVGESTVIPGDTAVAETNTSIITKTWTEIKLFTQNIINQVKEKLSFFLSNSTTDPYAPLTANEPKVAPITEQSAANPTVVNTPFKSSIYTEDRFTVNPLIFIAISIFASCALVALFLKYRS